MGLTRRCRLAAAWRLRRDREPWQLSASCIQGLSPRTARPPAARLRLTFDALRLDHGRLPRDRRAAALLRAAGEPDPPVPRGELDQCTARTRPTTFFWAATPGCAAIPPLPARHAPRALHRGRALLHRLVPVPPVSGRAVPRTSTSAARGRARRRNQSRLARRRRFRPAHPERARLVRQHAARRSRLSRCNRRRRVDQARAATREDREDLLVRGSGAGGVLFRGDPPPTASPRASCGPSGRASCLQSSAGARGRAWRRSACRSRSSARARRCAGAPLERAATTSSSRGWRRLPCGRRASGRRHARRRRGSTRW